MWKNVHPVYGAGIQTHNFQNMSILPWPLDKVSPPAQLCYSKNCLWYWLPGILDYKALSINKGTSVGWRPFNSIFSFWLYLDDWWVAFKGIGSCKGIMNRLQDKRAQLKGAETMFWQFGFKIDLPILPFYLAFTRRPRVDVVNKFQNSVNTLLCNNALCSVLQVM